MGDYDKAFAAMAETEKALRAEIEALKTTKFSAPSAKTAAVYDHDVVKKLRAENLEQEEKIQKLEASVRAYLDEITKLKTALTAAVPLGADKPLPPIKFEVVKTPGPIKRRSHKKKAAHK